MKDDLTVKPMQPYIMLEADNLNTVDSTDMGISHFYEFELNQDSTHQSLISQKQKLFLMEV